MDFRQLFDFRRITFSSMLSCAYHTVFPPPQDPPGLTSRGRSRRASPRRGSLSFGRRPRVAVEDVVEGSSSFLANVHRYTLLLRVLLQKKKKKFKNGSVHFRNDPEKRLSPDIPCDGNQRAAANGQLLRQKFVMDWEAVAEYLSADEFAYQSYRNNATFTGYYSVHLCTDTGLV